MARFAVRRLAQAVHLQPERDEAADYVSDAAPGDLRAGAERGGPPCAHDEPCVAHCLVEGLRPPGADRVGVTA